MVGIGVLLLKETRVPDSGCHVQASGIRGQRTTSKAPTSYVGKGAPKTLNTGGLFVWGLSLSAGPEQPAGVVHLYVDGN